MGQIFGKPPKIQLKSVNASDNGTAKSSTPKSTDSKLNGKCQAEITGSVCEKSSCRKNTESIESNETEEINISRLSKIFEEVLTMYLDDTYDLHREDLISRGGKKRPISKDSESESTKKLKTFVDVYSYEELVDYLDNCSNSEASPSLSNNFDDFDLSKSPKELLLEGRKEVIDNFSMEELYSLLVVDQMHFELAKTPELITHLTFLMDAATRKKMVDKIIDLKNNEGNSAVAIALLNNNIHAVCYLLIKRRAQIPRYIYANGQKKLFLHYLACTGHLCKESDSYDYVLIHVLTILVKDYNTEEISHHLCDIDNESGLSLPHLLLKIYQENENLRPKIEECIKICVKTIPASIQIQCRIYGPLGYKFDVIAHSLVIPETYFGIVEELFKLNVCNEFRSFYRELYFRNHKDQSKRDKLIQIIYPSEA